MRVKRKRKSNSATCNTLFISVNSIKLIEYFSSLLRIFIEKNLKQKYAQKLKFEYKMLENKERMMFLSRIEESELNQFDERVFSS